MPDDFADRASMEVAGYWVDAAEHIQRAAVSDGCANLSALLSVSLFRKPSEIGAQKPNNGDVWSLQKCMFRIYWSSEHTVSPVLVILRASGAGRKTWSGPRRAAEAPGPLTSGSNPGGWFDRFNPDMSKAGYGS